MPMLLILAADASALLLMLMPDKTREVLDDDALTLPCRYAFFRHELRQMFYAALSPCFATLPAITPPRFTP